VDNFRVSFGYNKCMTLTPKQKQIYDFIKTYSDKKGFSPTHEEIAKKFKLAVSTIHEHLSALEKKGYIKKEPGQARTIEVISPNKNNGLVRIPLLGTISAGGPIAAIRNTETIEVPFNMLSKGTSHYALKVLGISMIEEGIADGDVVIVREQSTVDNGEKAVAYLPDKDAVTLKKIYRDKNRIKLVPANKTMKPFYEKEVEIQGKVIGVLRKEI